MLAKSGASGMARATSRSSSAGRVGASDAPQVGAAAGVGGGAQLGRLLLGRDDPLALEVAALLGPLLVLQDDARDAERHALAHRAHDVERVAVASVHIGDERDAE